MRVLVTGAAGFLGKHVVPGLAAAGHDVVAASRQPVDGYAWRRIEDLRGTVEWDRLLQDIDAAVHLANIAHQTASEADFERVNHQATVELCAAAKRRGLAHLVFVSSIYAQVGQHAERLLTEDDTPAPANAYGRSKLAAERAVAASGVPFTNLRPMLVLGEGAKGNVATLYKLARLPLPLPLGSIKARRSFVSLENVVSALVHVLGDERAKGQTFIVANRTPLSVGELVADVRGRLGRRPGVVTLPGGMLEALMRLPGGRGVWDKIGRPLVASSAKLMALGWSPTR